MIRILLVVHFILAAIRLGVAPWRFFQLNSIYFNEQKGLFSKLDLDFLIPEKWRLPQVLDDGNFQPARFPVFVKPEWGQNSHGIHRADSPEMLEEIRKRNSRIKTPFIIQDAARGGREFEVFYIRSADNVDKYSIITVTETENSGADRFPVNSVNNPDSSYHDRTKEFTITELHQLWEHLKTMGRFRIARVGLRADSMTAMLEGDFQIIEINIFLPMPLSLLDETIDWSDKYRFIQESMTAAARMVGTIPEDETKKKIFFRKVRAHYRVKKTRPENERTKKTGLQLD